MQTKFFLLCFMFVALTACASPEEKAAEFLANGEQLLSDGDLVKARLEFRNALQIDNKLASAWYGLAQIAQQNSEWREAYGFLEKVLNIEPNGILEEACLSRALVHCRKVLCL